MAPRAKSTIDNGSRCTCQVGEYRLTCGCRVWLGMFIAGVRP